MKRALRIAHICGAIPLAVGLSIFALWLLTRWDWLMLAGIFVLYAGLLSFVIGAVALARFAIIAFRDPNTPRKQTWRSILGCSALLTSNFAVAGGIFFAVVAIHTSYVVIVQNRSPALITEVRVFGGGCDVALGRINPGAETKCTFWIKDDGELKVRASIAGAVYEKIIDPYVTHSGGGKTRVVVDGSGVISSQRL